MSIPPEKMRDILQRAGSVAVVGLSDNPQRDSFKVASYLKQKGYKIYPVNPRLNDVLGEKAYPDLNSIPGKVDLVNIFRRNKHVPPVVEEALKISPLAIWMQLGVVNEEAAIMAREKGVTVIMDKCIMVEHRRLFEGA